MASAGWTLTAGQPVTRTVPPVTTAAARNGTALDRSGSMCQCRAATGPGAHPPPVGVGVVDVDAGLRAASPPSSRCAAPTAARHRCARTVRPSVNVGAGEQQSGHELRRRRGVDLDGAARDRPGAAHRERQAVAVDVDAQPAQRVEQRRDRPGAGLLVAVERDGVARQGGQRRHEPQHRAGQAAVDARIGRRGRSSR